MRRQSTGRPVDREKRKEKEDEEKKVVAAAAVVAEKAKRERGTEGRERKREKEREKRDVTAKQAKPKASFAVYVVNRHKLSCDCSLDRPCDRLDPRDSARLSRYARRVHVRTADLSKISNNSETHREI